MGKKLITENSKFKKPKKEYKEMFPQLATHREEIVQRHDDGRRHHQKRVIHDDSEQEVELDVLEHQNNDLDTICETVHRLLSKNKVSAKNAFDVPLIDLQQLPDFTSSVENEYAWKKLSSTLENDYKIYAYRVDAIHSITYNILHTMSRRQQDIDALQSAPVQAASEPQPVQSLKISEGAQSQYLQRKIENLNLTEFQLALGVDPILQRNKRNFDQPGGQNMLLNTLAIDEFLALQLVKSGTETKKYLPWGDYSDIWASEDPLMAFIQLAEFRAKTAQSLEGKMRDQEVYEVLFNDKENHFCQNYPLIQHGHIYNGKIKEIGKEIKLKPTKQLLIQSDMIDEANTLMEERFLSLKKNNIRFQPQVRNQIRLENPEDLVNFQLNVGAEQDTRTSVFMPERDKNEFREEIQDKFLLALRLPTKFQIQKYPLTLKQNPKIVAANTQNVEVDVRRQQISISDAKKKMIDLIHQRSTFKELYNGYKKYDQISPALCFLTLLHLANENGFGFQQIDTHNFYIR